MVGEIDTQACNQINLEEFQYLLDHHMGSHCMLVITRKDVSATLIMS
jgi:hypothetical protein